LERRCAGIGREAAVELDNEAAPDERLRR